MSGRYGIGHHASAQRGMRLKSVFMPSAWRWNRGRKPALPPA